MSQAILEALKTKLYASQGVGTFYAAVGGRIYQDQPKPNELMPFAVFTSQGDEITHYMGGVEAHKVIVSIDLYGKKDLGWEVLGDIEELLYDLLDQTTLTVYDRGVVLTINRGARTVEDDAFRVTDEFSIEATEM